MIYFIQQGTDGPIKIGTTASNDIRRRIHSMQTGNPETLHCIGATHGDYTYEKHIHKLFDLHRLVGEWFKPDKPLIDFIKVQRPFTI